ncbi:hypothetical protein FNF31_00954 [Cafeteria roenbergensis]|uniref:Vesicle transport protein n=1 Tax=Cafeteria roenbergensis TaxID=33653 RepID=A0A5A8E4S2_CAFRO|nr:hypothetical protein FNF31_00954 [Cafeteria roenbergensis]KAA0172429.1 hypothetical protein FNF28_00112 [Cafeteria roenbergensis]
MMDMIAVTDAQKVGLMLVGCGALFLALGSLLLFDRALLTIGNLLFLSGFPFLSGPWATLAFFSPIPLNLDFSGPWWHRARAAGCFWLGFILVLARWTLVGMLVEVVGIVLLFARFAKPLVRIGQSIPLLGSLLQLPGVVWLVNIIDDEAGRARPKV